MMRLAITPDAAALLERCVRLDQKVAGRPRACGPAEAWAPGGASGGGGAEAMFGRVGAAALIPVDGPIWFAPSLFSMFWGGTTVGGIGHALAAATADASIETIVLDVHSPGGDAAGMDELFRAVAACPKPVHIFCHDDCCSMAYVMAAAARLSGGGASGGGGGSVIATPTAAVGSIGVYGGVYDTSEQAAADGVRPVFKTTAAGKMAGIPGVPVSPAAEAEIERGVLAAAEMFWGFVAQGRGVDVATQQGWQGAVFHGTQALEAGLVDQVISADLFYAALADPANPFRGVLRAARAGDRATTESAAGAAPVVMETAMTPEEIKTALAEMDPAEREALLAEYMPEDEKAPEEVKPEPEQAASFAQISAAVPANMPNRAAFIIKAQESGWNLTQVQREALGFVIGQQVEKDKAGDTAITQAAKGGAAIGGGSGGQASTPGSYTEAVDAAVAGGKSRAEAVKHVNATYPELRKAAFGR